jgi:hypothetical protein
MLYSTDPKTRTEFINSLRVLAGFLDSNPDIPVPKFGTDIIVHATTYEDGGRQEVTRLARLLDVAVSDETPEGHCRATRMFGVIEYRVISISTTYTTRRQAQQSYEDVITLDTNWE